ncbi:hypothetical protein C8F04DRAFT_472584 [Mycena alexandri]|uniref:F-box domain-containing protein n=1 Tax=Mycena alexandri TaxID=1745969 RepID=A0AAD6X2I1_9AGAR|nr:hypothetical protein C8F04DRAFT_472584 [Mycena alexandri]
MQTGKDTELLQNHLSKSDALLLETEPLLQSLDTKLKDLECETQTLERRISTIERLIRIREMYSKVALKLRGIEKKGELATKRLGAVVREKKSLLRQQEQLHRRDAALRPPLTLELFRAAPIRRVSVDVLAEIFMAAKSEGIERLGEILPVISQVCGEWRAVALDHPVLWASFALSLRETNRTVVDWLKLYLERSKTVPLTIEVDARTSPIDYYSVARAIDLLATHSERLRGLRLKGSKWDSIGGPKDRDGRNPICL